MSDYIHVSEDALREGRRQAKKVIKILTEEAATPEYKASYRKVQKERRRLKKNPVKCFECKISATCIKHNRKRYTQCIYGLREFPKPMTWEELEKKMKGLK